MIKKIAKWYHDYKKREAEKRKQGAIGQARILYQVKVFNGELWFVFNGNLVCPVSFFVRNGEVVGTIERMQEIYVKDVCGCKDKKK